MSERFWKKDEIGEKFTKNVQESDYESATPKAVEQCSKTLLPVHMVSVVTIYLVGMRCSLKQV